MAARSRLRGRRRGPRATVGVLRRPGQQERRGRAEVAGDDGLLFGDRSVELLADRDQRLGVSSGGRTGCRPGTGPANAPRPTSSSRPDVRQRPDRGSSGAGTRASPHQGRPDGARGMNRSRALRGEDLGFACLGADTVVLHAQDRRSRAAWPDRRGSRLDDLPNVRTVSGVDGIVTLFPGAQVRADSPRDGRAMAHGGTGVMGRSLGSPDGHRRRGPRRSPRPPGPG